MNILLIVLIVLIGLVAFVMLPTGVFVVLAVVITGAVLYFARSG